MDALIINDNLSEGFLGSFLSNNIKTNQLEVNTDLQTSRAIARLKEPRNLFALPKDKDHECSQQTARWPAECQVLDERVFHICYVPATPEPYYQYSGQEIQPRPVGEENGSVVYIYNPLSAVNYKLPFESNVYDLKATKAQKLNTRSSDSSNCSSDEESLSNDSCENDDNETDNDGVDDVYDAVKSVSQAIPITIPSNCTKKSNVFFNMPPLLPPSPPLLPARTNLSLTKFNQNTCDTLSPPSSARSTTIPTATTTIKAVTTSTALVLAQMHTAINSKKNQTVQNNFNASSQFSRSSVGSSKYLVNAHLNVVSDDDLVFESRFESGNLAKAIKITPVYYELYLRPDLYTNKHTQWFYFRVTNVKKGVSYRISIVNLVKSGSLYNEGMRPLMYSEIDAKETKIGWKRCGENISYFKNEDSSPTNDEEDESSTYTLTFNIEFPHEKDTVYFAHSYPYTYSDLQDYLMTIQKHPVKSKFCKLRLLCRSLAGNNVYCLTVTTPVADDEIVKKRAIVVSARVHPGETPSSWMMKGLMDFITSDSLIAKKLRHKFIFKLIPMLNPDGVIVGNTRSSLTGKDLNRQYRTVIRETYPSVWYTKTMIKRLTEECGVAMYCDMHAHSRKHNIFIYGCENKRDPDKKLAEQVFPLMLHKNVADKFSFESCKFKVQRNKEGTGRIVIWMLGITNSYTMEASFGGSTIGGRTMTHFSTADYEHIGRAFCETLLDFSDENPTKEKLRTKILNRLNEGGSNADEPLNIKLSDYSSDEGDTSSSSSSSDNEMNTSYRAELEGFCCQSLPLVPPSSPISPKKSKTNKKLQRTKGKSANRNTIISHSKKANKSHRSAIELPTAEPHLGYCTSDYDEFDENRINNIAKSSSTKIIIRKEQRQRPPSERDMPNELIVTCASQKLETDAIVGGCNKLETEMNERFSTLMVSELPAIKGSKRQSSWQNVKKCVSMIKMTNVNVDYQQTVENLKIKLSLKKQIWNGITGTTTEQQNIENSYQPLSWGIPATVKKNKSPKTDENEELLAECSQRLMIWKQDESKRKNKDKRRTVKVTIPKVILNNGKNADAENPKKLRKKKLPSLIRSTSESPENIFVNVTSRTKPLITETDQSKAKIALKIVKAPSKFKTGGIAATACLKPVRKFKKLSDFTKCDSDNIKPLGSTESPTCGKITLKKVKTKLKKKRNDTLTQQPAAIQIDS